MESKIKQDTIHIGKNIRRIRKEKGIGQTELVRMLQLNGIMIVKVKSFAPRQIQRRLFAALVTLSRKVFRPWHKWF